MAYDLWQIRRRKKMTIDELSRRAGIPPGLIKAYELGQRPIASGDIEKLAKALLVEPWDIKELSDPPPRGPNRFSSPPRFGTDPGSSYSDPGRSTYSNDSIPSRFGTEGPGSRYDTGFGRSSYGGGGTRRPRYDNDAGRPSGPRRSDRSSSYGGRPGERSDRGSRSGSKGRSRTRQPVGPARTSQIEHLKTLIVRLDLSGDDLLRMAGKPLSMLNRKEAAKLLTACQNLLAEQKPPRPKGKRQRPYLPESVDEHELVYLTEIQLSKRPVQFTLFNGDTIDGTLLGFSPYALTVTRPDGQEVTLQKLAIAYYQVEPAPVTADEEDGKA